MHTADAAVRHGRRNKIEPRRELGVSFVKGKGKEWLTYLKYAHTHTYTGGTLKGIGDEEREREREIEI